MIRPSQGVHIVLPREFLPGTSAIMVPHTDDGRVLFAIPWQGRVVVGTTDTPIEEVSLEPVPLPEEIDFLLEHTARYLTKDPGRSDILSAFAGIRPLAGAGSSNGGGETAAISRDHTVHISRSGLVTSPEANGPPIEKWRRTLSIGRHSSPGSRKNLGHRELRIHGYHPDPRAGTSPATAPRRLPSRLSSADPRYAEKIHPVLEVKAGGRMGGAPQIGAHRRGSFEKDQALLLDARAALEAAPLGRRGSSVSSGKERRVAAKPRYDFERVAKLPPGPAV
jgi:glycerol-3-phosphate dehydrogenase